MRWHLIDNFFDIQPDKSLKAQKLISHNEKYLEDAPEGDLSFPPTLLIEMMAQAGGVLAGIRQGFQKEVILGKIETAIFHKKVAPPDRLIISANISHQDDSSAWAEMTIHSDHQEVAHSKIMFVYLDHFNQLKQGIVFNDAMLETYGLKGYKTKNV